VIALPVIRIGLMVTVVYLLHKHKLFTHSNPLVYSGGFFEYLWPDESLNDLVTYYYVAEDVSILSGFTLEGGKQKRKNHY
jgi:hypothetical protein